MKNVIVSAVAAEMIEVKSYADPEIVAESVGAVIVTVGVFAIVNETGVLLKCIPFTVELAVMEYDPSGKPVESKVWVQLPPPALFAVTVAFPAPLMTNWSAVAVPLLTVADRLALAPDTVLLAVGEVTVITGVLLTVNITATLSSVVTPSVASAIIE